MPDPWAASNFCMHLSISPGWRLKSNVRLKEATWLNLKQQGETTSPGWRLGSNVRLKEATWLNPKQQGESTSHGWRLRSNLRLKEATWLNPKQQGGSTYLNNSDFLVVATLYGSFFFMII